MTRFAKAIFSEDKQAEISPNATRSTTDPGGAARVKDAYHVLKYTILYMRFASISTKPDLELGGRRFHKDFYPENKDAPSWDVREQT